MKKFLKLFCIVAVFAALGYGITALMSKVITPNKTEKGYIAASDIKIQDGVMTPEALLAFGRLGDPQLSPDGNKILYGVSYTSIEKNRSCRNLFVCDPNGGNSIQLTKYAKSVSNARWSPDGKKIYFLQGGQLWAAAFGGKKLGAKYQLSDVPAGISEFKLSPDGSQLLYISTIPGPVKTPKDSDPALDKAQAYATTDLMYRHWDHWVTETPRTYVASLSNGKITPDSSVDILGDEPFELPTEPFGGAEQLDWAPNGRHIAYSCRKKTGKEYAFSTNCGIYVYDLLTGETTPVKTDGGYDTDPLWSPDGAHLAWISMARDGYEADKQRILVAEIEYPQTDEGQASGVIVKAIKELTAGFKYDASGLLWAEDGKSLYFSALAEGTGKIYNIDLEANVKQLTQDGWKYDFFTPFAVTKDGTLLTSYYCLNFPVELVAVGKDGFKQLTAENKHILDQLDEPTSESVLVKTVDGQDMQCWVLYPPHFDPSKKYPAVEIVLGGPQSSNTQDWSYRWNYRLMAQQG